MKEKSVFEKLLKELYDNLGRVRGGIIIIPEYVNLIQNKRYIKQIFESIKQEISKIYEVPKNVLDRVNLYFVDYLPNIYKNTITLGVYESLKNSYGKVYSASVYVLKKLLYNPKKLIETIAHELTHYIQDLRKKIKKSSSEYASFKEYYNSEEELEARAISKEVLRRLYRSGFIY
ncbi:MAG: hypothetical protein QXP52_00770 [Candidatus Aenigmatarchaeota archaeon]